MKTLINNQLWEIIFVPWNSEILWANDGYTYGVTLPLLQTIYIADDIGGEMLYRVLYHELAHAEFASRGLYFSEYEEEALADIVSDSIVDVNNFI